MKQETFFQAIETAEDKANYQKKIAKIKAIKKWYNDFQAWLNKKSQDSTTHYGKCGYGAICDCCDCEMINTNVCIKAFNEYCKVEGKNPDIEELSYEDAFMGRFK